jgi:hypothetical protein
MHSSTAYGGWRDEVGFPRPSTANPVLRATELAGEPVASPAAGDELAMDFADQPVRKGEAILEALKPMLQSRHIVGHLHHIVQRCAWSLFQLEQQEIGKGRLGALDLRRKHGFLPHVGVKEKMRIGQQSGDAVEAPESPKRDISYRPVGPLFMTHPQIKLC